MLESKFQSKVISFLKSKCVYNFKTISSNRGGIPDIICCYNGRFISFELKTDKNKQSELQKIEQERITKAGGEYILLYNTSDWKDKIMEVLK